MKTIKAIFFILLSTILFGCNENTPSESVKPTGEVSIEPTVEPTKQPTVEPTVIPSNPEPTVEPTQDITIEPTVEPTQDITVEPTIEITPEPTPEVTPEPETSINVEEISSIINQTFDLSNVTILYVNAPSATEKEIFISSEIYYENVDSVENYIYNKEGINYKVSKIYGTEEYENNFYQRQRGGTDF